MYRAIVEQWSIRVHYVSMCDCRTVEFIMYHCVIVEEYNSRVRYEQMFDSRAVEPQGVHTSSVSVYVQNIKKCMGDIEES